MKDLLFAKKSNLRYGNRSAQARSDLARYNMSETAVLLVLQGFAAFFSVEFTISPKSMTACRTGLAFSHSELV